MNSQWRRINSICKPQASGGATKNLTTGTRSFSIGAVHHFMKMQFSIFDLLAAMTTLGVYLTMRQMIQSASGPPTRWLPLLAAVMSTLVLTLMMFRKPRVPRRLIFWIGIGAATAMLSFIALATEILIAVVEMYPEYFSWKEDFPAIVATCLGHGLLGGGLGIGAGLIAKLLHKNESK